MGIIESNLTVKELLIDMLHKEKNILLCVCMCVSNAASKLLRQKVVSAHNLAN